MSDPADEISASQRRARNILIAVASLFTLLHLFINTLHLVDRALWLDEASTYGVAAHSFWRNFSLPIQFHSQPPLYYLVLHLLIAINSHEWFLRGFSWGLILILIWWVLFYLEELAPHARVFLAFILVYGPFTKFLSQELRPYALCAVTSFVSTILFLRALADPTPRRAWRYAISAILTLYSLAFDVWVFTAHGLYFLALLAVRSVRLGPRRAIAEMRALFVAMAGVVVAYLPYLTAAYVWQGHSGSGHPTWIGAWHAMTAAPYAETLKSFLPLGYPYSFVLWGLLLVVVCVDLAQRRSDFVLWTILIIGQIAFVHGFLFGRSFVVNRYYTPAYPALLYLFALGVHRTWTATRRYWWVAPVTLAFLVWDSYAPFAVSARAPLGGGRWRALHQVLSAVPGRKVVFFDVGYDGQMLEYEARRDADIVLALQKGTFWAAGGDNHLDPEYIEATIAREAPKTRCFYYVLEHSSGPYSDVFLPTMKRLGYREAPSPGQSVNGFCKP